jgi:hypothetical protein
MVPSASSAEDFWRDLPDGEASKTILDCCCENAASCREVLPALSNDSDEEDNRSRFYE